VHGNIVDHEYRIERGGKKVAEVSKKWFRVADTYGVEAHHDLGRLVGVGPTPTAVGALWSAT
jgi:uncharacterized protein YxjI